MQDLVVRPTPTNTPLFPVEQVRSSWFPVRGRRLRAEELVEHPLRCRLLGLVHEHAGLRTCEAAERVSSERNTVEYHLNLLRRNGLVALRFAYGYPRWFAAGPPLPEGLVAEAVLRRTRFAGDILRMIEERPGITIGELGAQFDLAVSHVAYYARPLVAARLVYTSKEGRSRRIWPGSQRP